MELNSCVIPVRVKLAKLIRESAGISQSEMARRLGQTRQAYHLFERRNSSCTARDLAVLRDIFQGSDKDFLDLVRKCAEDE